MSQDYDVVILGGDSESIAAAVFLSRNGLKILLLNEQKELGGVFQSRELDDGSLVQSLFHDTSSVPQFLWDVLEPNGFKNYRRSETSTVDFILNKEQVMSSKSGWPCLEESDFKKSTSLKNLQDMGKVLHDLCSAPLPDFFKLEFSDLWGIAKTGLNIRSLGKKEMMELLRILPLSTQDFLSEFLKNHEKENQLYHLAHSGIGTAPFSPGGTLALMLKLTFGHSGFKGEGRGLVDGLKNALANNKVEIRNQATIKSFEMLHEKVGAVILENGEKISAKTFLSCENLQKTFFKWMDPKNLNMKLRKHIQEFDPKGSIAKVHLVCESSLNEQILKVTKSGRFTLAVDKIKIEKAHDALKYKQVSEEPWLDVYFQNAEDQSFDKKTILSIQYYYAPYQCEDETKARAEIFQNTVKVLGNVFSSIKEKIIFHEVLTPKDLENKFSVPGGHFYGGNYTLDQFLIRPFPECSYYKTPVSNLYLGGSFTFPGGLMPCLSGILAAKEVLRQF